MQKEIAQEMGFLTEDDITSVFKVMRPTLENCRRNSTGLVNAHFGNQFFYPISAVAEFLTNRLRNQAGQQ